MIELGEYRANSPRLALRWLRDRAERLADQLDAPHARPVRAWLGDEEEHTWALGFLTAGETYTFRAVDGDGVRYVLIVEPVAASYQSPGPDDDREAMS